MSRVDRPADRRYRSIVAHHLTNCREVLAYSVAHGVRIVTVYLLSYLGVLAPLYKWAYGAGGRLAILPVSFGLSVFWAGLALLLFLAARGIVGGVPPVVAGSGREEAVTTTRAEIGAYVLAQLIGIVALIAINSLGLAMVYTTLYRGGHPQLALSLGAGLSVVATAVVFVIFVAFRRAFSGARQPGRV